MSEGPPSSLPSRRPALLYVLVFVAAAMLNVAWLGRAPVADTTEARHAEVAREFAAGGHWLVPTLNGRPHLTKPPLTDWLAAAGIVLFGDGSGVAEFGVRFMNALVAAAAVALAAALAARLAGREAELPAAALLFACPFYLAFGRTISIDILLAALTTAGYMAVWAAAQPDCRRPRTWALVLAAAMGLGALAKGHVILLVLAAPALAWLLLGRRWEALRRLAWPPAWILFAALALPWFVYIETTFPGWLKTVGQQELSERLVGTIFGSATPGSSVAYFLGGILPAAPLAVLGALSRKAGDRERAARQLLLLWILVPLTVFSLASGQRPNYVVPMIPAAAALAAIGWRRLAGEWSAAGGWKRAAAYGSTALTILLAVAVALGTAWLTWGNQAATGDEPDSTWVAFALVCGGVSVLAGAACTVLLSRSRTATAELAFLAALLGVWGAAVPAVAAYKDRKSTHRTAAWLRTAAELERPVMAFRECPASFCFYWREPVPIAWPLREPDFRRSLWPGGKPAGDLAKFEDLVPAVQQGAGVWLVTVEGRWPILQRMSRNCGLSYRFAMPDAECCAAHLSRGPGGNGEKRP